MHGVIINLTSNIPFVFQFNPVEVSTEKPINYFMAPNIGGSSIEAFFSGFGNREVRFQLKMVDKNGLLGVREEVAFFESLGEPDPGLLGVANSFFGNENYPPPKVLYQFGVSIAPLVYDVASSPIIRVEQFRSGEIDGLVGVPTVATVDLHLRLDENNVLNKAEQIAKKVAAISGSAESIVEEAVSLARGTRKEAPFA